MDLTDVNLVNQTARGDRQAFRRLVERHQSLVCSVAYSIIGDVALSEDVAQEAFLTAWTKVSELREPGKFAAWICGIARNLALMAVRRERKAEPLDPEIENASREASPPDQAVAREEEQLVWHALEALPDSYREPLVLFYREHHSVTRVAEALDLSEAAVKQRLSRGREMLREEIAATIERTLKRTAPKAAFVVAVLCGLPAVGTANAVAATGVTTGAFVGIVKTKVLLAAVVVCVATSMVAYSLFRLPEALAKLNGGLTTTPFLSNANVTRLENGATLILKPVSGVGRVAIESIYDVGFVDEPKEMCQASHLLLNLVCFASTENYRDGESSELFKCLGAANGEVLPDWTHYDYTVPSDQLGLALKVETERLTNLQIDSDVAARQIPLIYQQVDWLEKKPDAGMVKHAFMAFSQAWRNGQDLALVRGGLESIPIEQLRDFHAATYCPERLTLVIAGDFDLEKAKQNVQETIGSIKSRRPAARRTIDWENIPQNLSVEWDATLSAVCVYYPPPAAALDRIVLSYLGTGWIDSLSNDPTLKAMTDMVTPSPVTWPVGELPFFVYAAVKPGIALDQVEQALKTRIQKLLETPPAQALRKMQANATMIVNQLEPGTGSRFSAMVDLLARQQKMNRGRALDMALGHSALSERTLRQLGGDAGDGGLEQLRTLQPAQLKTIVDATVNPAKQHTIRVVPKSIAQ